MTLVHMVIKLRRMTFLKILSKGEIAIFPPAGASLGDMYFIKSYFCEWINLFIMIMQGLMKRS